MPTAALQVCPGCHALVARGRCPACARPAWGHREPVIRIRGHQLQRLRKQLFDRQPLCVLCQQQGRVSIATIRDHIVPLTEGGRDDETNAQPLCQTCSDLKTAEEARRGQQRIAGG